MNSKVNYSFEEDIFSGKDLYNRKYDSSFQLKDLIFDMDDSGKISGVEILNASKIFNLPKVFLKNMVGGELRILVAEDSISLIVSLKTLVRNSEKLSTLNIERVKPDFLKPSELNLVLT